MFLMLSKGREANGSNLHVMRWIASVKLREKPLPPNVGRADDDDASADFSRDHTLSGFAYAPTA
jgi:hypothetical protein